MRGIKPTTTLYSRCLSLALSLSPSGESTGKCNVLERAIPQSRDHSSVINLSSAGLDSWYIYFVFILFFFQATPVNGNDSKRKIYYSSIWHSYSYLMAKVLFDEWGDRDRSSIIVYVYIWIHIIFCCYSRIVLCEHMSRYIQLQPRWQQKRIEKIENKIWKRKFIYAIISYYLLLFWFIVHWTTAKQCWGARFIAFPVNRFRFNWM